MKDIVPTPPRRAERSEGQDSGQVLNVENLHLHQNDLHEIRLIAETNPALAEKIVDLKDREDQRANISYRFGLVTSLLLAAMILACVTILPITIGVLPSLGLGVIVLALALLIRVILTGEWSDTSWFSKGVEALAKALGSTKE